MDNVPEPPARLFQLFHSGICMHAAPPLPPSPAVVTVVRSRHFGGWSSEERDTLAVPLLAARGLAPSDCVVLGENEAEDLYLPALPDEAEREALYVALTEALPHADVFVQPTEGRRKKLFLSDMDSTVIEQECIDELAAALDLGEVMSAITDRAMRGEIDFSDSLSVRVKLLAGAPCSLLEQVYNERVRFSPGAEALVAGLKAHGVFTVLVSGGFTFFAERVAKALGFERFHANVLAVEDDKLTGEIAGSILKGETKRQFLLHYSEKLGITPEDALCAGDGANDLPMLEAAGAGVAYRAKPKVDSAARHRLRHNDLSALLYMQGYPAAR